MSIVLAFVVGGCTNAGGCKAPGTPPKKHVATNAIRNNAMQARLSPSGFDFVESDLIAMVEAALQKPLALKIPKTPLKLDSGTVLATICDKPDGCDATLKVIPETLKIRRLAPDDSGKSQLEVDARVEIEAKEILKLAGDPGFTDRDCQIDVRYIDHRKDVCKADNVSWAKPTNTYNPGNQSQWEDTIDACNAFCAPANDSGEGRGIGASMTFGVDEVLGYPEVQLDDVRFTFSGSPNCPAANDLRVFHPTRAFSCEDGSTDCEVFERSILSQSPVTCLLASGIADLGIRLFSDVVRSSAKVVINQQLRQAMAVKCTKDDECQAGATCSEAQITTGFPENCAPTGQTPGPGQAACLMQPVKEVVCNVDGKVVPPLAGIETEVDLGTLDPAYTPDNAGPVKLVAAVGGFAANDATHDDGTDATDDTRGLTIGGFFGIETSRAGCVAPRVLQPIGEIEPLVLPQEVELWDSSQKKMRPQSYHAAVSLHRGAIATASHAMYTNGALCMTFSGTPDFPLNSSILALIIESLNRLEEGEARPSFMYIFPEEVPRFEIGEGRIRYEGDKPVLEAPHAEMHVERLRLDFYSMLQQRYVRLFSISVDFDVGIFLEFNDKNQLIPVTGDLKGGVKNVKVKNSEILQDQTKQLEENLPKLLDFALPIVSQALFQGFPLPDPQVVPGYDFKMVGIRGVKPIPGTSPQKFEFMSAFGMLQRRIEMPGPAREALPDMGEPPMIASVEVEKTGIPNQVKLVMASDAGDDVEYAYKLNGGMYSLFAPGNEHIVERDQLGVAGPHKVEVIARRISNKTMVSKVATAKFETVVAKARIVHSDETSAAGCQSSDVSPWILVAVAALISRRLRKNLLVVAR